MKKTTLSVRNMVCDRCIKVVRESLKEQGYNVEDVSLGRVVLQGEFSDLTDIDRILQMEGFERIDDQSRKLVNEIRIQILHWVRQVSDAEKDLPVSAYLEQKLHKSYSSLSHTFSSVEGRTIEKYAILQRIEWVKELLVYGEKTVSQIAWETGYSSAQYLSRQFKSETGLSPTQFRDMMNAGRMSLDKI